MNTSFEQNLAQYRQATHDAIKQLGGIMGVPVINRQEHLQALRNMNEQDLDALANEYGADQVAVYLARLAGG